MSPGRWLKPSRKWTRSKSGKILEPAFVSIFLALVLLPANADPNLTKQRQLCLCECSSETDRLAHCNAVLKLSPEDAKAYYSRGLAHLHLKQPQQALADFSRAIELDPENPSGYHERAETYLALAQPAKAIADYRRVLALSHEDAAAHYELGMAYFLNLEFAEAIAHYNQAIERDPEYSSSLGFYAYGLGYFNMGQNTRYLENYAEYVRSHPEAADTYSAQARRYQQQGWYRQARFEYELALHFRPDDAHLYLELGRTINALSSPLEAIKVLNRAIELEPELAEAYYERGWTYYQSFSFDQAFGDYRQAVQLRPAYAESYYSRGVWPRSLAEFDAGKYFWQVDWQWLDLSAALALNPADVDTYFYRGIKYALEGGHDAEAAADFETSLRLRPDFAPAHFYLGEVYASRAERYGHARNYAQALDAYQRAIELKTDIQAAYLRRGRIHSARGRFAEAIADFSKLVQSSPESAEAYFSRAAAYHESGNFEAAISDYTRLIQDLPQLVNTSYISPDEPYFARGLASFDLGNYSAAIADLSQSLQLKPENADAHYYRGLAYFQTNLKERARADFNQAAKLIPKEHHLADYSQGIASYLAHTALQSGPAQISAYHRAIRLKPGDDELILLRGVALAAKGLQDEALGDFGRIIARKQPGQSYERAFFHRAALYQDQGRDQEALADYAELIRLWPGFHDAYMSRANLHHSHARFSEEISDYTIALHLLPEDPNPLPNRAYAYARIGRFELAEADLEQLAKMAPGQGVVDEIRGLVAYLQHRPDRAKASFERSLQEFRPYMPDQEPPDRDLTGQADYLEQEIPHLLESMPGSEEQAGLEGIQTDLDRARLGNLEALTRVYTRLVEIQTAWLKAASQAD
ncbi:MAG: tetratricopeptide repeat protein [Candidatus Sericytochromatia bacterium]